MAAVRNSQARASRSGADAACSSSEAVDRPGPTQEVAGLARLLIVGHEPAVAESVPACLRFAGYETHVARSGAQAMALCQRMRPDLIVLDTRLPDVDGLTLARAIRRWHSRVPAVFLASMGEPLARAIGLTVGADDYLVKPFSLDEVTARVRAGLRRADTSDLARGPDTAVLRFADLELNEDTQVVRRAGQPVQLTPREREILRYLLVNAGRIVTRAHIHEHVWPYGDAANPRALDVHICTMRRKLDRHGPSLIHTMHGVGYILRKPDNDLLPPGDAPPAYRPSAELPALRRAGWPTQSRN